MASAIDSKPFHGNSGLVDPYTLAGTEETRTQGKPPAGNLIRSPSVARKTTNFRSQPGNEEPTGDENTEERIYVQIETKVTESNPNMEQRPSRHRTRCRCKDANQSPERTVKHDAFITPQPRILTQRANSANRLGQSTQVSKCEAVQIVDLQVSAIGDDATKEQEANEPLVPISRPGSAQPQPSARRKKHHVVVISREGRDKPSSASGTQRKTVLASQSLTDLVNRYPDPRRPQRSVSGERDTGEEQDKTQGPDKQALSTIHSVQGEEEGGDVQVKTKSTKQVRINSAVQIYDDLDVEENHRNRLSYMGVGHSSHGDRNSRSQIMNITKLRQDVSYKAKPSDRTRIGIPDNIPQGSVVRIQHTSKGKIKVITGSEGQFTTTILEGNRKPPGGPRPPTRLDLMEDVLVITRKTSTSKDACITSRPSSGTPNSRAIQSSASHQKSGETSVRQRGVDGSPRKIENKHGAYAFRDRIQAAKTQGATNNEVKHGPKAIELNNPYAQISDGKGEVMQRSNTSASLYYQNAQQRPILSARQQRWKPKDSLPEPDSGNHNQNNVDHKVGKHKQYAQSRYRLQTDSVSNKPSRQVTFQYDSHKPPPADGTPVVEEEYTSPNRHRWELEYDDYAQNNKGEVDEEVPSPKEKTTEKDSDFQIIDAQSLAEKQYYAARHKYVKQWRDQHPRDPQGNEKETPEKSTHTVVMQASSKQTKLTDATLPPKQQLWSKDTFLQSNANHKVKGGASPYPNSFALPAPPRSPSRSRSRRRSASRTRRPATPNTNLVADQLQDEDEKGAASRRSRLQATSTELFEDSMYENFAHSKFKNKSRPSSSSKTRPQVVDRETMVKLLHMTMPKKQQEPEQF